MPSQKHSDLNRPLKEGMYVRVPLDLDEAEDFRDFRIGQVTEVDDVADTVTVSLQKCRPGQPRVEELKVCQRNYVQRCHILPLSTVTHKVSERSGRLLVACSETWSPGRFCDYFVQIDGEVKRVSEAELVVASHRQDPSPCEQLRNYEFQNPVWKWHRNRLVKSYAQLKNATFGMEDLVGSRVMLLAHQAEVIMEVLGDPIRRYVLADEVGLGKTIEACVILKGLLRRHPGMKTLIVAPASLTRQWHYELNNKFWLDFSLDITEFYSEETSPGLIVSTEDLADDEDLHLLLNVQEWGLLIVDEAHHIRKSPNLYLRIHQLSADAQRALILSATPIQRRTDEYLALLKLMNPTKYNAIDEQVFREFLDMQQTLRRTVAYISQAMTPSDFDPDEFVEEMQEIVDELAHDDVLPELVNSVSQRATSYDRGLSAARQALAYVTENYRIERRVIRNRRANLDIELPKRQVDTTYSYMPGRAERAALEELHDYINFVQVDMGKNVIVPEYYRVLLHAAHSSPHALLPLLQHRLAIMSEKDSSPATSREQSDLDQLLSPAEPRLESQRIRELISEVPMTSRERPNLERLIRMVEHWLKETDEALADHAPSYIVTDGSHRLVEVLRATYETLKDQASKVVIFSAWTDTIGMLLPHLQKFSSSVAQFHRQVDPENLQREADRFQAEPSCRVLLCDELGGEGRNFQIADRIIHVDLPWTPSQIEQRIGRVDRLGREGTVLSIVPFAQDSIEQDLYRIWQDAFHLFTQSMSGLEIVLEGIQSELIVALAENSRDGLRRSLPEMISKATNLLHQVEEERYFEQGRIDYRRRDEFRKLSEDYRDGKCLGRSIVEWAKLAGLKNTYRPDLGTVRFHPRRFNQRSMYNAKYFTPPNMVEALIRSRRTHTPVITGTFSRDIAMRREDLVFYAPGEPWTDTIIENAIEADRGRCCAVVYIDPNLKNPWQGFEFFYSIQIDPRPLYEGGFDPVHLLRAQGYLYVSTHRFVISTDGHVLSPSDPIHKRIKESTYNKEQFRHLGKRENGQIDEFRRLYPSDKWQIMLDDVLSIAEDTIEQEFSFMAECAQEAEEQYQIGAAGLRAAQYWLSRHKGLDSAIDYDTIAEYERVSSALIEGIRHPFLRLESACFWVFHPGQTQ